LGERAPIRRELIDGRANAWAKLPADLLYLAQSLRVVIEQRRRNDVVR
jgi:hypothetical protein